MSSKRKKNKCIKGYNCGLTCISGTKACRKEFPEGISISIGGSRKVIRNSNTPLRPSKAEFNMTGDSRFYENPDSGPGMKIKGDLVIYKLKSSYLRLRPGGSSDDYSFQLVGDETKRDVYDVEWSVYSYIEDKKMAIRAALEARTIWKEKILPTLKDGTILQNMPLRGAGGVRDRAYQKSGFGRVTESGEQYAIVKNGKLVPLEPRAIDIKGYRNSLLEKYEKTMTFDEARERVRVETSTPEWTYWDV